MLYKNAWESPYLSIGFGSAVLYCMICGMTFSFLITYIKRMITLSLLIIISPIVALTYSVDKMGAKRSKTLNTWLKEFTFNVLIQPFHCIIYTVFMSITVALMATEGGNFGVAIFAFIILRFMKKAEETLRRIFAFQASSGGNGFATVSAIAAGASTLKSLFNNDEKSKKKSGNDPIPDMKQTTAGQSVVAENAINEGDETRTEIPTVSSAPKEGNILARGAKAYAKGTAKASLPMIGALIASSGDTKSMLAGAGLGMAATGGIGKLAGGISEGASNAFGSGAERKRRIRENEIVFQEMYRNTTAEWKQEIDRKHPGATEEEIQREIEERHKQLLAITDINRIVSGVNTVGLSSMEAAQKIEEAKKQASYATALHTMRDTYKAAGYSKPEEHVLEVIQKFEGKKKLY